MKNTSSSYEESFMEEVEKKIIEMEKENYEFPQRFSKKDYIITGIVVVICLIGVVLGAFI